MSQPVPILDWVRSPKCLICDRKGQVLHAELHDRLHGVPGSFHLLKCEDCGLAWLDPRPADQEIRKCYPSYYTHQNLLTLQHPYSPTHRLRSTIRRLVLAHAYGYKHLWKPGPIGKLIGYMLSLIPLLRRRAAYSLEALLPHYRANGRLLDVGCGNGEILQLMQWLGWRVEGVEPDPVAAEIARKQRGVHVRVGSLFDASFDSNSFDVITMSHSIEHVPDPVSLLAECRRILTPGGTIGLSTPNLDSLGYRYHHDAWFPLEPPRHLILFTPGSLAQCIRKSGLEVQQVYTVARHVATWFMHSQHIRQTGQCAPEPTPSWAGRAFSLLEHLLLLVNPWLGEEINLIARKPIPVQ